MIRQRKNIQKIKDQKHKWGMLLFGILVMATLLLAACSSMDVFAAEKEARIKIPVSCAGANTSEAFRYHITFRDHEKEELQNIEQESLSLKDGETGAFELRFRYPEIYHYTVTQEAGTDKQTTYDNTVYEVTVYVTEDEEGTLIAEPIVYIRGDADKKVKCDFHNKKVFGRQQQGVKTGDETKLGWMMMGTGMMFLFILISCIYRKKQIPTFVLLLLMAAGAICPVSASEAAQEGPSEEEALSELSQDAVDTEYFDRYLYQPSANAVLPMAEETTIDMKANIRKRAEWTDRTNGDGKITLQYASDSGMITGTEDMNVVLIQDKSGSMDSNYGFNLEKAMQSWGSPERSIWFPIRAPYINADGQGSNYSETLSTLSAETNYQNNVNYKNAASGYPGYHYDYLTNLHMGYNSPCQLDDHYYLLVADDEGSALPAWLMVNGTNLYNINNTDLHHYQKITREEAIDTYLPAGRRVISMRSGVYVTADGTRVTATNEEPAYFLDVSQMIQFNGKWILSCCGMPDCQVNDRLSKSQEFVDSVVTTISNLNPNNQIAYVPFWGDVPKDGSWSNASADASETGIEEDNENRLTSYPGVTMLDFSTDYSKIKAQIDNPFTYDGTNWSRAFANTVQLLNQRSEEDKKKQTLIIFLTDGMPQGTAGKASDFANPEINGESQLAGLKEVAGVTVYAVGTGVNQSDTSGLAERLASIDSNHEPAYARVYSDYAALEETIANRIKRQYAISIDGKNAFYTDTLTESFDIKESLLDDTWNILESPSQEVKYGVPQNVFDAVSGSVKQVYVKSTKTVYWYIGDMTNGDYDTDGHTCAFPIQYSDYQIPTDEKDKNLESNTTQMLTYVTTQRPDELRTVMITSPAIVFSRQAKPEIVINKTIAGAAFPTDQTYRFLYSKNKQIDGRVTNYLGSVSVNVKAGAAKGTAVITDLDPGRYYIYEVDANDYIIHAQVSEVLLTESAEISTINASDTIPASVVTSDGTHLENSNNYLQIRTAGAAVEYTNTYAALSVSKTVEGNMGNKEKEFHFKIKFSKIGLPDQLICRKGKETELLKIDREGVGTFTLSHHEKIVIQNIPVGTSYEITELDGASSGYTVEAEGAKGTIKSDTQVLFRNTKNGVIPTGVKTNVIVMCGVMAAGLLGGWIVRRRR